VILSMLAWNGIPAYGMNLETIRASASLTLALGGIPIRVARDHADEARMLLGEAAERVTEAPPPRQPLGYRIVKTLAFALIGAPPPPRLSATITAR
jgi:hypothetical protein